MINGAFGCAVFTAETDVLLKVAPHFMMGPRAGLIFFNPSWIASEGDVTLTSKEPGFIAGYDLYVHWSKIKVGCSIDYMYGVFDVDTSDDWVASSSELDISGLALRLGVTFTF